MSSGPANSLSVSAPRGRIRIREDEARYLLNLLRRDRFSAAKELQFYDRHADDERYVEASKGWRQRVDFCITLVEELQRTAEEMGWRLDR